MSIARRVATRHACTCDMAPRWRPWPLGSVGALLLAATLAACATAPPMPDPPPEHPASPQAAEAPPPERTATLEMLEPRAVPDAAASPMPKRGH